MSKYLKLQGTDLKNTTNVKFSNFTYKTKLLLNFSNFINIKIATTCGNQCLTYICDLGEKNLFGFCLLSIFLIYVKTLVECFIMAFIDFTWFRVW